MSQKPIACTLKAGDFKARLAAVAELNRRALRETKRCGLTLELSYASDAAAEVREMVRQEQECCAFLAFELVEEDDRIRLQITAPEEARMATEEMFAQFSATRQAAACGCLG